MGGDNKYTNAQYLRHTTSYLPPSTSAGRQRFPRSRSHLPQSSRGVKPQERSGMMKSHASVSDVTVSVSQHSLCCYLAIADCSASDPIASQPM
eukprot:scaffold8111_cov206-Skeletonema_marinoi.AAC.11